MNKFITIILTIIFIFMFVGCDNKNIPPKEIDSTVLTTDTSIIESDFHVEVVSGELVKDRDDKDVLAVILRWTNNSTENAEYSFTFGAMAFQNGIELHKCYTLGVGTNTIFSKYDELKKNNNLTLKPGASLEVVEMFYLRDWPNVAIEFEVGEIFGLDTQNMVEHIFKNE